jgi:chondroitin-sulfate-ABC endolyase/exolyase
MFKKYTKTIMPLMKTSVIKLFLMSLLFLLQTWGSFYLLAQKANGSIIESDGKILSFERHEDLDQITSTHSTFLQSNAISMLTEHSLQWDWEAGASLSLPLYDYYSEAVQLSPFEKNQCLVLWIYNERPSKGALTFILGEGKNNQITCKYYLDYTGWRTAHIPLSQMTGEAPQKGDFAEYRSLTIKIQEDHPEGQGRFFIDDVYTTVIDARHPSADYQAPYVKAFFNGGAHVTQWMNQKELPTKEELKMRQIPINKLDVKSFEALYDNELKEMLKSFEGKGLNEKSYQDVLRQFETLKIKLVEQDGTTYLQGPYIALQGQGLPKNIIKENIETGRFIYVKQFEDILYSLAQSYHKSNDQSQKQVLKENFLLATKAYLQSGWTAGSNMGALHHLGYSTRKIAPSFFLMKRELDGAGLLYEVSASLNWFAVAHVVSQEDNTMPDLDLFNTVLYSHYLASMMHPDKKDATRHAILLSQWMSRTFADYTKHGGFQHDGTAWHHWGHYPAYTKGAIDDAVKVTNKLTKAGFPLSNTGFAALQKAVKTIMLYSQGDCIPRSLSGRHPLTGSHKSFIHSAYTKTFVNLEPIDTELKDLYLYHTSNGRFTGHWTLPYSALNVHRRDNYLATVRGFGIYAWGSEIYNFNRFGRYQSYGTIDILYKDAQMLPYEGYDWNLNPGTTITYLPLKELESPIPIFMVKSLSRFANGVHDRENRNGAHGFILDESTLINIDPGYEEISTKEQLKARKSTFFMDDLILCLGSGISGQHDIAPVYTVLTQEPVDPENSGVQLNGQPVMFPQVIEMKGRQALYNGKNTGFVVLQDDAVLKVSLKEQISRGDECTFDELRKPPRGEKNGKINLRREPETKGDFVSAVIDHGVHPGNARYEYAILPQVDDKSFNAKAKCLLENPELYYRVISRQNKLHAVRDIRNQADAYICYEAQCLIPHSSLYAVSDPCLLIMKENNDRSLSLSVALPDLHQPAVSREQKHKHWSSREHKLKLSFDGIWTIENNNPELLSVNHADGFTYVVVNAQHGLSYHFTLLKSE